jgi:hypothetical protein
MFRQVLHNEMAQGDRYIGQLMAILPAEVEGVLYMKDWMLEFSDLLSKVHRAMAALEVRLEQGGNGR